jgi:hypothetical protein
MAGRPRKNTKPRIDIGAKRGAYVLKEDKTGRTIKENPALKGFWSTHKVEDIMSLSPKELDKIIDEWLVNYEASQLKRNSSWWYPFMHYDPKPKVKKEKKINKSFNSTFVFKKVI